MFMPPSNNIHDMCCRVLSPNGSDVPKVNAGFLPQ
jgi:hypothetical protein